MDCYTMEKKRKHHDVWRAYLEGWTKDGQIFCLTKGKVFPSGLMGVANRRDFYTPEPLSASRPHLRQVNQGWIDTLTFPTKVASLIEQKTGSVPADIDIAVHNFEEDFHAKIESDAVRFLAKLRQLDASFFGNDDDRADFLFFLCEQIMRTANMQSAILTALGTSFRGIRTAPVWKILRHMFASNMAWVFYAERSAWRLVFLDNPTNTPLITADQPIINTLRVPGKEPSEIELYYPLSSALGLLVTEAPSVTNGSRQELVAEQVHHYNSLIVKNSAEQLYAESPEILESIKNLLYG
jgi:hypothetical protein